MKKRGRDYIEFTGEQVLLINKMMQLCDKQLFKNSDLTSFYLREMLRNGGTNNGMERSTMNSFRTEYLDYIKQNGV